MLNEDGFPIVGTAMHDSTKCSCGAPVGYVCGCEGARVLPKILEYSNRRSVSKAEIEDDFCWIEVPYPVQNMKCFVTPDGNFCKFVYESNQTTTSYWKQKEANYLELPVNFE